MHHRTSRTHPQAMSQSAIAASAKNAQPYSEFMPSGNSGATKRAPGSKSIPNHLRSGIPPASAKATMTPSALKISVVALGNTLRLTPSLAEFAQTCLNVSLAKIAEREPSLDYPKPDAEQPRTDPPTCGSTVILRRPKPSDQAFPKFIRVPLEFGWASER